ncbi:MAG: regulatory protein GemA [Sphingomonadaceae bacterium]
MARVVKGARPRFAADPRRRACLAKVHLARKELRLSEDDYRTIVERATGKRSAGDLEIEGLEHLLREFERLGWQPGPGGHKPQPARAADHPAARKARALWISLQQLGAIDNGSEAALEAFARRQLGCARLQWADQAQVYKLTEALKAIAARHGWHLTGWAADDVIALIRLLDSRLLALDPDREPINVLDPYWERLDIRALYATARALGDELAKMRKRAD